MIELKNVSFSYGTTPVLKNISGTFYAGELCGIVGANGCGKTTLIRLLSRLEHPSSGEILMDLEPYETYGRKEFAKKASLLPQERPIPAISVREFVSHGRFPHLELSRRLTAHDREIVTQAMQMTDTLQFAHRSLKELSGGERQRAYLAMLLAQDTPHVLLDEPTTYLDISMRFSVMKILSQMRDSGKCVVAVLHDLSLALQFCDRLWVMERGTLRACGTPRELVSQDVLDEVFAIRCTPVALNGRTEYLFHEK